MPDECQSTEESLADQRPQTARRGLGFLGFVALIGGPFLLLGAIFGVYDAVVLQKGWIVFVEDIFFGLYFGALPAGACYLLEGKGRGARVAFFGSYMALIGAALGGRTQTGPTGWILGAAVSFAIGTAVGLAPTKSKQSESRRP